MYEERETAAVCCHWRWGIPWSSSSSTQIAEHRVSQISCLICRSQLGTESPGRHLKSAFLLFFFPSSKKTIWFQHRKSIGTTVQKILVKFGYSGLELIAFKEFVLNCCMPSVKWLHMHKTTLEEKEKGRRIDQWNPLWKYV